MFRRLALPVMAVLVVLFGTSTPVSAESSGPGVLVVDPPSGDLDSVLTVSTVGPCERGVTLVVYGEGKGINPGTADNLVGNTSLGKLDPTYTLSHSVPLMTTLGAYFQANVGKQKKGTYEIVLACRDTTDFTDLQTFRAEIEVSADGTFEALGESAKPIEQALTDAGLEVVPGIPEQVRALAADPVLGDLTAPSPEVDVTAATTATTSQDDPQQPLRSLLLGVGVLLIVGAGLVWWRSRSVKQ